MCKPCWQGSREICMHRTVPTMDLSSLGTPMFLIQQEKFRCIEPDVISLRALSLWWTRIKAEKWMKENVAAYSRYPYIKINTNTVTDYDWQVPCLKNQLIPLIPYLFQWNLISHCNIFSSPLLGYKLYSSHTSESQCNSSLVIKPR